MFNFSKKNQKEPKYKVNDYVQFVTNCDFIYCGEIWKIEISKKEIWYYINYRKWESINVGKNFIIPECNIIKKLIKE